jgi:hypothetical protein
MSSPASAPAASSSAIDRAHPTSAKSGSAARPLARRLRVSFRAGAWHLHEEGTDMIGGIFTSLSAAVAFGRGELRGDDGATLLVDKAGEAQKP